MVTLHFIPTEGCFLGSEHAVIREPTLEHLRTFIRLYPLPWVTA